MLIVAWIRVFLIAIPLAVVGFSIYWIVLVTDSVFVSACGPGRIVIGVFALILALASSIFAFFAFRELPKINYSSVFFHLYLIITCLGLLMCAIAMVATTTESQGVCASLIDSYCATRNTTDVTSFLAKYDTDYKRLLYKYAFGQSGYEGYLIMGCAWAVAFVTFFAIAELK